MVEMKSIFNVCGGLILHRTAIPTQTNDLRSNIEHLF